MDKQDHQSSAWQAILKYAGIVMSFVYVLLGVFVLMSGREYFRMDDNFRIVLGVLLVVYGCYRSYRIYHQHFKSDKP